MLELRRGTPYGNSYGPCYDPGKTHRPASPSATVNRIGTADLPGHFPRLDHAAPHFARLWYLCSFQGQLAVTRGSIRACEVGWVHSVGPDTARVYFHRGRRH